MTAVLPFTSQMPRPAGMPFVTQRLIVGYPGLIRDPLTCLLLTSSVQSQTLKQWLLDVVESRGLMPHDVLKLEDLFDQDEITDTAMDVAVTQIFIWMQRMLKEIHTHRIYHQYHAIKNRLHHDYCCVYSEVMVFPDKVVFEIQAYYPDDAVEPE